VKSRNVERSSLRILLIVICLLVIFIIFLSIRFALVEYSGLHPKVGINQSKFTLALNATLCNLLSENCSLVHSYYVCLLVLSCSKKRIQICLKQRVLDLYNLRCYLEHRNILCYAGKKIFIITNSSIVTNS